MIERNRQQCEEAMKRMQCPPFERAGGGVTCEICGHEYYAHPNAVPWMWLTILCDGSYVKL
jgi:hypothetical protein